MNTTILLTQVFGILFTVLGLSMLFSKKGITAALAEMSQHQGFLWLVGLVMLMFGTLFVVLSNTWTSGLALIVTIISWLILIKGVFILLFPSAAASLYGNHIKAGLIRFSGLIVFILGLILLYKGC